LINSASKDNLNTLATKDQQTKMVVTGHHTKTIVQRCIIMLHNNSKAKWNR